MTETLVYDGDCGFCTVCAHWAERHSDANVTPWQSLDLPAVGLTEAEVTTAAYWLGDGPPRRGARAIAATLRSCRGPGWRLLGRLGDLPPVRPVAAAGYWLVARNRHRLPGSTEACRIG